MALQKKNGRHGLVVARYSVLPFRHKVAGGGGGEKGRQGRCEE